jgi:hypothetical protein
MSEPMLLSNNNPEIKGYLFFNFGSPTYELPTCMVIESLDATGFSARSLIHWFGSLPKYHFVIKNLLSIPKIRRSFPKPHG